MDTGLMQHTLRLTCTTMQLRYGDMHAWTLQCSALPVRLGEGVVRSAGVGLLPCRGFFAEEQRRRDHGPIRRARVETIEACLSVSSPNDKSDIEMGFIHIIVSFMS